MVIDDDVENQILKADAEVVEDVEKDCFTCDRIKPCNKEFCVSNQFSFWMPKDKYRPITFMDNCGFVDGKLVTNSKGAKQSKIDTAFSLVPHDSLMAVAKVMKIGSERYEKDNWRKLSTDEIYDHLMEHLVNWHMTGNMEDLEHGMTRAMMLYSVANDGQ